MWLYPAGSGSKRACVQFTAVIMGLGASNQQRELFKVFQSPSMNAETCPDTHIFPESILQQGPSKSGQSKSSDQLSSKRTRP